MDAFDFESAEFLNSVDRGSPPEWMIVASANGAICDCCGEVMQPWRPGIVNLYTVGLEELYNHMELQIVLGLDIQLIANVLNEMGMRIRAGAKYKPEDILGTIFEGRKVRIDFTANDCGEPILRMVLQDDNGHWPEDQDCVDFYALQAAPTPLLRNMEDVRHKHRTKEE